MSSWVQQSTADGSVAVLLSRRREYCKSPVEVASYRLRPGAGQRRDLGIGQAGPAAQDDRLALARRQGCKDGLDASRRRTAWWQLRLGGPSLDPPVSWMARARPPDDLPAQIPQRGVASPQQTPRAVHGNESGLSDVLGNRRVTSQQCRELSQRVVVTVVKRAHRLVGLPLRCLAACAPAGRRARSLSFRCSGPVPMPAPGTFLRTAGTGDRPASLHSAAVMAHQCANPRHQCRSHADGWRTGIRPGPRCGRPSRSRPRPRRPSAATRRRHPLAAPLEAG